MTIFILLIAVSLFIGSKVAPYAPRLYETGTYTVAPKLTPAPVPVNKIIQAIAVEFEPEGKKVVLDAIRISFCESGWRPEALNTNKSGSTDHSIFQVNSFWKKVFGDGFTSDWRENIRIAHKIWLRNRSFGPWVCMDKL